MSVPRCTYVLGTDDGSFDKPAFFRALSQLDARDTSLLTEFMDKYRDVTIRIIGVSDSLRFHDESSGSPDFEQFSVDLWREYYVQEDIIQIGLLQDREPNEGLFIGKSSGRVYICGQADDFSQQKVMCIADDLYSLIWRGPHQPVEYKSGCLYEGCYGCFDPVLRNRVFKFKQF